MLSRKKKGRASKTKRYEPACIVCHCTETNACVDAFGEGCAWVIRTKGSEVCSSCYPKLTTAAPALFNVLRDLVNEDDVLAGGSAVDEGPSRQLWKRARAVLVKAGGAAEPC